MRLRDYQNRLVESVREKWRTHRSTIVVAATGTGKTVIICDLARLEQPARILMIAHRNELIVQAREKLEAHGLHCEIEKAELYATTNLFYATPVVVSSIQTLCSGPKDKRRYTRFKPTDFSIIICDECHHAAAPTWREVLAWFTQNPATKVLGVTATPDRADEKALGQIFESVAGNYEILDAIQDGYLVDITQQFVTVQGLDYSHIHTVAGDLNEGELATVLENEKNVHRMCQPILEAMHGLQPQSLTNIPVSEWKEHIPKLMMIPKPRRTIVFAVSVLQSQIYCEVLSRAMNGIEWVCGATRKEERAAILRRFADGQIHAVVNCGVLTEGFDNPGVELIVMARPTKSRALYTQMVGRSTRPLTGLVDDPALDTPEKRRQAIKGSLKPYCRILDFVGNSGKHKLVTCLDILGGKVSPDAAAHALRKALKEGKPVRVLKEMTDAEVEIEKQRREAAQRARDLESARKAAILAKAKYTTQDINPFGKKTINYNPNINRGQRQLSEKQRNFIRNCCNRDPNTLNYWQGTRMIDEEMKRRGWGKYKKAA